MQEENGGERAEMKMKKYHNGELIGQLDKTIDISDINSAFLIRMNSDLDAKSLSDEDDLGIEYED